MTTESASVVGHWPQSAAQAMRLRHFGGAQDARGAQSSPRYALFFSRDHMAHRLQPVQ